jgi:nodulation protein E
MPMQRVVITGLGSISAVGADTRHMWKSLVEGSSGIGPIQAVDRSLLRFEMGAEVRGFDPLAHFEPRRVDQLDRFAQFALVAAREAVRDARLEWTDWLRENTAVITGSCLGGKQAEDQAYSDVYREDRGRVHPMTVPRVMANAATSHITMEFGIHGPAYTVSSACSSASHALGQAFWLVRQGSTDMAIAGGSETPFSLVHLKAWEAMRVVAPDACRPFAKNRRGLILGEGAAVLILESLESARRRGAEIHGEIVGFGMSADASHVTMPASDGAALAIRRALRDAELRPEQVGYINAHGTGTLVNDPMETRAIRAVFGPDTNRLAVSSTKSMHGHALGATGAIEAVATVLTLKHGVMPPTINYSEPDPECDLDVVPNVARRADFEYALSNSFAFGGLNAVLVFRRWHPDDESRLDAGI